MASLFSRLKLLLEDGRLLSKVFAWFSGGLEYAAVIIRYGLETAREVAIKQHEIEETKHRENDTDFDVS